jgi:hypothetical protein
MAAVPLTAGASAVAQALATTRAGSQLVAVAIARTGTTALVLWPGEAPPVSIDPLAVFSTLPEVDPIDLLDEVPPYEREAYEIQAVLQVVGNELLRLETARQAVALNFLPGSADALLPMFEQLLGLPVDPPGLTLASRQQLVQASMLRLKGQGSGLDWEAAISSLLGGSWSYQESDPNKVATNYVPNPSFERDTVGQAPVGWGSHPGGWSHLVTGATLIVGSGGYVGTRRLQVTTAGATQGIAISLGALPAGNYTTQIAVRGDQGGETITCVAGQDAASVSTPVITLTTAWQLVTVPSFTSAGANPSFVCVQQSGAGSEVFYVDAVITVQGTFVPPYFDGDTAGAIWSGTPGNSSSSWAAAVPANTVSIKIPQAMAGIAWPFIRDLTPAHLAIIEGYSDGFFVDISTIGSHL